MLYQFGYVYYIKDEFFELVDDDKLMKNKEDGKKRPTYYAAIDSKTGLIWVVPMSTKFEKYEQLYNKKVERYGECDTIVLGRYCDKDTAFLIQNIFPITHKYIHHIHTKNGNPVPVNSKIQQILNSKIEKVFVMRDKGINHMFPNVEKIEEIMLEEKKKDMEEDLELE